MFVQIIEGQARDPEAIQALGEKWERELQPGAVGYLGVTSGVAADGRAITVVRFDSAESARLNSERPEQTAFFNEMSALYDGAPSFAESTDVETMLGGIVPSAQFVQVMKTVGADRVKTKELDAQLENFATLRPDLLGIFRVWTALDTSYELAYFTSEAEARAGESQDLPEELAKVMADYAEVMANTEFIDLVNPRIV